MDSLAKEEHNRWYEERRQAGWTFGPVKDVEKKCSPALMRYENLPKFTKEVNRTAIRRIPVWLAKAGVGSRWSDGRQRIIYPRQEEQASGIGESAWPAIPTRLP